ncbi:hypothetical protein GA0070560_102190 [Micromonospora halophytica]|uniref:Uncharacterized protein n=1 Tax=Micromonospora halophytica TaxID=47864 RepID=A0A1C5GWJ4_9ACTN|nr:hypothetical protein GA0070560_102190 [Micromonospora halophytica]
MQPHPNVRAAQEAPAGGVPQAVFPTTYAHLLRITSGTPAEVA